MLEVVCDNSYLIFIILGIVAGFPIIWKRRQYFGFQYRWQVVLFSIFISTVCVASAMLMAKFEAMLMGREGGLISLFGVFLFGAPILGVIMRWRKWNARVYFDSLAYYFTISLFFVRCNCLISGCCGGKEIFSTGLHWPTREAELIFYILVLWGFRKYEKASKVSGLLFPLLMLWYGVFRFINECFRVSIAVKGWFHISHIWAVLCAIVGASIYNELRSLEKIQAEGKRRSK